MTETNIYYPTHENPFVVTDNYIFTPICSRGYTGAQIIKIVLEELVDKSNIRDPYGITADPKFVYDGEWYFSKDIGWEFKTNNNEDYKKIIYPTDVTVYSETDEFEKVFGYKRCDSLQNVQTQIMKKMGMTSINRPNLFYTMAIEYFVWNFYTDKQKVFILLSMDEKELDAVKKNLKPSDILLVIRSYNEVAYPSQKYHKYPIINTNIQQWEFSPKTLILPFSENAYKLFYCKLKGYFKK